MRWATLLCLLALAVAGSAQAQATGQVTGRVTGGGGAGLAGVTVNIRNTARTALTGADGRYTIAGVPAGPQVVQATRVGYAEQTQAITVAAGQVATADFQMAMQAVALEGVVAVGYGTQRKVELTSAVTAVDGEELAKRPARNVQSALQGQVAGVAVWDQGGEPGAANMYLRVRGTTTLGNNSPLVIVDGIEQNWGDLNPNEIETISVLKDAASTAIYGSRGANGIVLITTKRGRAGNFRVSYNSYVDFQNLAVEPEHMDTESYLRLQNLAFVNRGSRAPYSEEVIQQYVTGADPLRFPQPNRWFDTVIRDNAPMQNHSLTVSGGTGQLTSLAALNFFDQQGVYPNRDASRYQFRLNNDFRFNDRLKVSADLNLRRNLRTRPNYGGNIYHWMIHGSQWTVPRYPDGSYGLSPQGRNPLAFSDPEYFGREEYVNDYGVVNFQGNWELLDGLEVASQYGIEVDKQSAQQTTPTYEIRDFWNKDVVLQQNSINALEEARDEYLQKTWNNTLTYRTRFLEDHSLTMLAGYSEISYDASTLSATGRNLYNNFVRSLGQSDPENRALGSRYSDWGLRSFFGRAQYSLADRYLFEANMRYDGSSRFPEGDRYTFFPSLSAGWRISEEPFWEPLRGVVSELKPRASWGRTGNQNVGLYTYFDQLAILNAYTFGGVPVVGVRQNNMTARGLTWETTTQTNVGVDAGLFDGAVAVTFDWFTKLTDGILLNLPVPGTLGLSPAATNAGSVRNTGWEMQLTHRGERSDVGYGVTFNLSDVRNEVVDLAGTGPYFSAQKNWLVIQEGSPINSLWGYRTDGYYTQADFDNRYPLLSSDARVGDIKYVDVNGDGVIGPDDRTVLGNTLPRYTFGAALDLNWRNFDFNTQLQGVARQDMAVWGAFVENGSWEGFALAMGTDFWTPENPNARFPRPQKSSNKNTEPSEWWVESAAYARLKNLQLGYTLPQGIGSRAGLGRVRVYAGGTNLITLSGLNEWGIDAETVTGRSDYYPAVRTFTLGLNLDL